MTQTEAAARRQIEAMCDRIEAVNAEYYTRRQIEILTGKTPEILTIAQRKRGIREEEALLLGVWQDAAEAMQAAIRRHEAAKAAFTAIQAQQGQKGGEQDVREA